MPIVIHNTSKSNTIITISHAPPNHPLHRQATPAPTLPPSWLFCQWVARHCTSVGPSSSGTVGIWSYWTRFIGGATSKAYFTLGVWGLGCVRQTLRNRPPFGGVQRRVASFCVAGVALLHIPTCLTTCQKSFCVAGAILLRRFQKIRCICRGRRSTLKTSDVI